MNTEYFVLFIIILGLIAIIIIIFALTYLLKMAKLYQSEHVATYAVTYKTAPKGGICFIGDSLTEFYKTSTYLNTYNIINHGIAADTTSGVLDRLESNVYSIEPSKVFLQIGTNDFAQNKSKEEILDNIRLILFALKENLPNAKVYSISLYPVNGKIFWFSRLVVKGRSNRSICFINKELQKFCEEENITFIDMHKILRDEHNRLKKEYCFEGLHLNTLAYEAITKELIPYLDE